METCPVLIMHKLLNFNSIIKYHQLINGNSFIVTELIYKVLEDLGFQVSCKTTDIYRYGVYNEIYEELLTIMEPALSKIPNSKVVLNHRGGCNVLFSFID